MNPALPKTTLGIRDVGEGNNSKGRGSLTKLKSRLNITKKGRAG